MNFLKGRFFPLVLQNPPLATFVSRCFGGPGKACWLIRYLGEGTPGTPRPSGHQLGAPNPSIPRSAWLASSPGRRCERIPKTQPPPKEVILEIPRNSMMPQTIVKDNPHPTPPPQKKRKHITRFTKMWFSRGLTKTFKFQFIEFWQSPRKHCWWTRFQLDSAPTSPSILQLAAYLPCCCCNSTPATSFKSNRPVFTLFLLGCFQNNLWNAS